jgi:hypothetical protein
MPLAGGAVAVGVSRLRAAIRGLYKEAWNE